MKQLTYLDLITEFHRYLLTEKCVARNTFDAYKNDLKQCIVFLNNEKITINEIEIKHLKLFLKQLHDNGISARSMARKISCLKMFFSLMKRQFSINDSAHNLETPRIEKKLPSFLSEKDILELLAVAQKDTTYNGIRNKVMLYLLYATGMRISELISIQVSAVNFDNHTILINGKGGKQRLVPIPVTIIELLSTYITATLPFLIDKNVIQKQYDILFPTYYAGSIKSITRQLFWLYLKKLALIARIKKHFSPHTLRHSLATHLLNKGANIRSLQILLGHEQINTVQIYTHLERSHLRKIYDKKHSRS